MDWITYFNKMVGMVKEKSKDPSTKVGCIIVDEENIQVSAGFNGWVSGCDERLMKWTPKELKYHMVLHAEQNAVIFARRNLKKCKVFITHSPCSICLKLLLQAGARQIYYNDVSIVKERGGEIQHEAIARLILSTDAIVFNVNTRKSYIDELGVDKRELLKF